MIPLTFTPDPIQPARAQQGQAYMVQKRRATVSGGSGAGGSLTGAFTHGRSQRSLAKKRETKGHRVQRFCAR